MKNTKCWLWHTWGKWADLGAILTGDQYNYQIKECLQCGIKTKRWYGARF